MNKVLPLAALVAFALTGCGGSSSDNPQQPEPTPTPDPIPPVSELIRGTAASGAPIRGEVMVLDADGDTHTYLATDGGKFEFKRAELALPAIVKATGAAGGGSHEIYSLILEDQNITNITPLTQLLISRVSGVAASKVFDNFEQYKPALTLKALQEAQVELKSVLAPLLTAAEIEESFDLLNTEFEANYTSIDAVLDLIDIAWSDTSANISYKGNGYAAELKFNENWSNEKLSNSDGELTVEHIGNTLSYISSADKVLEGFIMAEEDEASAYLHPDAFWYGSTGLEIYRKLKDMYPNETDTMNRYKDYAIKQIAEDGSFLLSYTECYQDSPFATCGRSKAWFSEDQEGDITFMGRKDDIPLNVQAILIARRSAWADDQSAFDWSIEIDAFPDASSVCGKMPDSFNNTSWFAGIPKLAEMKDYMPVETVTITGNGIEGALVLDRIYKEVNGGIITACHLASSTYGYTDDEGLFHPLSLVIDGYAVDKQETIRDNTSYSVEYQYVDGSPNTTETITVGKGKVSDEEMAPYLASIDELRNTAGDFYMRWSRESQLATDIDVWVTEVNEYGSKRVAVEYGAHEVSSDELNALKHAYLVAFDEYGRSISVGYDFNN